MIILNRSKILLTGLIVPVLVSLFLVFGLSQSSSKIYSANSLNFPQYKGYVNDYENILNNDAELEQKLANFEKETTIEIAVITISDFQGTTIDDYAVKLLANWKIGKKDKDNGLLIVISKTQRQSRFEVGYGLEGTLPDALTGRIQDDYMIPNFKNEDYSKGVNDGLDATISYLKNDPSLLPSAISSTNTTKSESSTSSFLDNFAVGAIFLILFIMAETKSWWLGGIVGFLAGIFIGAVYLQPWGWLILPIPFALLGLILDFLLSRTPLGWIFLFFGRDGGSGGIGSSSSGGGMSFGGGSSGGGGSSRSW
jgi:uncharacterized protein